MSRRAHARFLDIKEACEVIQRYAQAQDIDEGMKFDAIRMRLVEIGEAAKGLTERDRAASPDVPWQLITGMRDHLAHRYWDTAQSIVMNAATQEVPRLLAAANHALNQWDGVEREE